MDQKNYFDNLPKKNIGNLDFPEFRSLRQKVAYASYSSMPDILIYVARMSQYTESMFTEDSEEPLRLLKKAMKIARSGPSLSGLKFKTIPVEHMEMVICIDAAFATNPDQSSQLGVLAMIRCKKTKCVNIIHSSSPKSKRVAKSALAAELFAMVDGNDVGFSIK